MYKANSDPSSSDVVGGGAMDYLSTACYLGISYWPAPERAAYLSKKGTDVSEKSAFILKLGDFINSELKDMAGAILDIMGFQVPPRFPGFGIAVLKQCYSSQSIISTALEFRKSKEAIAFRKWISEMETYLTSGNLQQLAKGLMGLYDVINDARKGLSLSQDEDADFKLQIGLSPSISINLTKDRIPSLAKWFRPKPLYMAFLRQHLGHVLSCIDLSYHVKRLFPLIKIKEI